MSPTKVKAVEKLELSRLTRKAQTEGMDADYDLDAFRLYLNRRFRVDVADRITEAKITRTIEGASTLDVSFTDYDRVLLRSGLLSTKLDVEIDGLWFRLTDVEKQDEIVSLTFEDREIAILRTYPHGNKKKTANRARATRAEFILNLVREVKEFKIPVVIPELHKVQPIEKMPDKQGTEMLDVGREKGLAIDEPFEEEEPGFQSPAVRGEAAKTQNTPRLTVKGAAITPEQRRNAETILQVGESMKLRRKILVCAIMAAIVESRIRNLSGGDADSVGLFQQRDSWGSYEERHDPATSSRMFYQAILKHDQTLPYGTLVADTQRPRADLRGEYDKYFDEANRIVRAYGIPGGDEEGGADDANASSSEFKADAEYWYYRGVPEHGTWKRESNWDAIVRLAEEVNARAFFVSGTFYYVFEDRLLKSRPIAIIREFHNGVDYINGTYVSNTKNAQLQFTARVGEWQVPPGSCVIIRGMGPWNGRWIVSEFERDFFKSNATITIKKPRPRLPEPEENSIDDDGTGWALPEKDTAPEPVSTGKHVSPFHYVITNNMVVSTPAQHATRPLGNWESDDAYDFKADPGTEVVAVANGVVTSVKRNNEFTHDGNIFGAQVRLVGDDGVTWWYTHITRVPAGLEGKRVVAGERVGEVTRWAANPPTSHLHISSNNLGALDGLFNVRAL